MSCFIYGALSAQRKEAPPKQSKKEKPPGVGSYVDVIAALVPAEILAANAVLLPLVSESTELGGETVTKITDAGNLELLFWLSVVFSIIIYFIGDRTKAKKDAQTGPEGSTVPRTRWGGLDWVRALIPAAAYVVWTMLQKSTAFDGVEPGMSEAARLIVAVFAAILLGALAKLLSDKADEAEPPEPAPEPQPGREEPAPEAV